MPRVSDATMKEGIQYGNVEQREVFGVSRDNRQSMHTGRRSQEGVFERGVAESG